MRIALDTALFWRRVQLCGFDEAHHLTHTRDPVVRSNVLESIKCLGAIDRTLFLSGGYELAYRGLFDSAHFAGRLVCVECRPYTDSSADIGEWLSILRAYGERMELTCASLLIDECEILLRASNGCIGLLEKILWQAKTAREHEGRRRLHMCRETRASQAWAEVAHRGQAQQGKAIEDETLRALTEQIEHIKASIRAAVEHPFRVVKRQFGHVKARYRGLTKSGAQVLTLFALSNLWMTRHYLLAKTG